LPRAVSKTTPPGSHANVRNHLHGGTASRLQARGQHGDMRGMRLHAMESPAIAVFERGQHQPVQRLRIHGQLPGAARGGRWRWPGRSGRLRLPAGSPPAGRPFPRWNAPAGPSPAVTRRRPADGRQPPPRAPPPRATPGRVAGNPARPLQPRGYRGRHGGRFKAVQPDLPPLERRVRARLPGRQYFTRHTALRRCPSG